MHRLAVRAPLRGRGFGQKILAWAGREAGRAGKAYLRLDCMADNPGLNRYYQSLGFVYRGRHEDGHFSASRYEKCVSCAQKTAGASVVLT